MAAFGRLVLMVAVFSLSVGCGNPPADPGPTAAVSGTVTVDEKPLEKGTIMFDPQTGAPPATLEIAGGKFAGEAPVGKNLVSISSTHEVPMDGAEGDEVKVGEETLPAKFNSESTLSQDVKETGSNTFAFDLSSK